MGLHLTSRLDLSSMPSIMTTSSSNAGLAPHPSTFLHEMVLVFTFGSFQVQLPDNRRGWRRILAPIRCCRRQRSQRGECHPIVIVFVAPRIESGEIKLAEVQKVDCLVFW